MPRGPRLDIPGMVYHVICRGIERREIFIDTKDYRFFLNTLERIVKEEATLYAFCLMPNHTHLLLKPKTGLATLMRRLLTSYALYFNRRHKRVGYLFQNRFKSTLVQYGEYFLELVRYIHLNPLRAGIVADLKDLSLYPYTGYSALMGKERASLVAVEDVLACFAERKRDARHLLVKFMREGLEKEHNDRSQASIKEKIVAQNESASESSVIDRRILGGASFAAELIKKHEERLDPEVQEAHLKNLLNKTASYFGLTCAELCSGTKNRLVAQARSVAVFLGARRMGIAPKTLADALGVRPSTVYEILRTRKGEHESKNIVLE